MIHNDIQNQLALLIKTSAPPLIDVADSTLETPQWTAGQQLPAHVIASLANGRFSVMIENQTLDMNLPRNTQVGENLQLVFVSGDPRPTFTLLSSLTNAAVANQSSSVNLSDISKLLTQIQANAAGSSNVANAANAASNTINLTANAASAANAKPATMQPLVDTIPITEGGTPPPTLQFANALRDAISQSGLFYESHQAQWAVGERPLTELLREPQAQLSPILNQLKQSSTSALPNNAAQSAQAAQSQPAAAQPKADNAQVVITGKGDAVAAEPAANQTQSPIHPATVPFVQYQLDMLGARQIIWQGQPWPGQEMEWTIEEDGHRSVDAEEMATWRTRLHMDFPVLGGVTAHLALAGNNIKIDFSVAQDNSAQVLRGQAPSLSQAMETSGLNVTSLTVRQDGES